MDIGGVQDWPSGFHPWTQGVISSAPALMIVGSYRCGTTSLFSYLAGHPEINPSLIKEPGFFFSRRIRETPSPYPAGHEVWAYLSMFRRKNAPVLLEGTANYLHDPGCAERILGALPNAKVIIALREPVARLISWYKFIQLRQWWDGTCGFERWIREQQADHRPVDQRPYHLQALQHGLYSDYVRKYLDVFGRERVHIVWFDELKRDPRAVMIRICRFIGIAPGYYDTYVFPTQNEAMKIRRPRVFRIYRGLHRLFFRLLQPFPRLQHELRVLFFGYFEPAILGFFTGPADPVSVPETLQDELRRFYSHDLAALCAVTGQDVPWLGAYSRRIACATGERQA
jgi:hypothetical protein